jgi:hypothetical protein
MKMRFLQSAKGKVIAAIGATRAKNEVGVEPVVPKGYKLKDVTVSNARALEKRFPKGK